MRRSRWLVVICQLALVCWSLTPAIATASPAASLACLKTNLETVKTDKADYNPYQTVHITGGGYGPLCDVTVRVTRPDGSVVKGDGTSTPGSDTVTTDALGKFAYDYKLNEIKGLYVVDVLGSSGALLASTTFADAPPPCPGDGVIDVPGDYTSLAVAAANIPTTGPCMLIAHGPATFVERVVIDGANSAGTMESQRIVVKAVPARSVTVTAAAGGPAGQVGHAFTVQSSKFITIKDFNLAGSSREAIALRGDVTPRNQDVNIEGNDIHNNGTASDSGGIYIGVSNPRTWVFNNLIRSNGQNGLLVDSPDTDPTYIVNNTIFGNDWNGIQRNASANTVLVNNLIVGNGVALGTTGGRWGLLQSSTGTAATITLKNNMFYKNTQGDISTPAQTLDATDSGNRTTTGTEGTVATGIAGCTFFTPNYSSPCTSTHAYTEIFVSLTDFHLKTTTSPLPRSPAIDRGTNTCLPTPCLVTERVPAKDFESDNRPQDGDGDVVATTDVGYDETPGAKFSPTITTLATPTASVGGSIQDAATLAGASVTPTAGGTITFALFGPSDPTCSGTATAAGSATVIGNGVYFSSVMTVGAGTWRWIASYSGDGANNAVVSACNDLGETSTVNQATPTIVTAPNPPAGTVGATLNDNALLAGGANPTGTITFQLFPPADPTCAGSPVFAEAVGVSGNGLYATSTGYVSTTAGTYHWTATYSGDLNNATASSACVEEPVVLAPATPLVATQIHDANHNTVVAVPAGSIVHDSATVTGISLPPPPPPPSAASISATGPTPTGSVTFTFFTSIDCTTGGSFAGTVTLVSGVAHPSMSEGPLSGGSYSFIAHYNGDTFYAEADSECEPLQVTQLTPTVITEIHEDPGHTPTASVDAGSSVHDKATVSGSAGTPTGSVTFTFFTSIDCTTGGSPAGTVTLDASGVAHPSMSEGPLSAGSYSFRAHYNGSVAYMQRDSACEPLTVTPSAFGFMTGGGQVIGTGGAKVTFGGNARGAFGNGASGHFNILNHDTGEHFDGEVTAVLNVDPANHEMTFCFTTKSGSQYTVRWRDNGEPGNTSSQHPEGIDKLTLATGCTYPPVAILWGVNNKDLYRGNIQWHNQ